MSTNYSEVKRQKEISAQNSVSAQRGRRQSSRTKSKWVAAKLNAGRVPSSLPSRSFIITLNSLQGNSKNTTIANKLIHQFKPQRRSNERTVSQLLVDGLYFVSAAGCSYQLQRRRETPGFLFCSVNDKYLLKWCIYNTDSLQLMLRRWRQTSSTAADDTPPS